MVLILTEAGDGIGFGHLTRMMALGEALIEAGAQVQLLLQWEGIPLDSVIEGRAWVRDAAWRSDPVREALDRDANTVIVDSYRLSLNGYTQIMGAGVWLAVIDDCYRLPFPANLVINPNVYAEPQRYLATSRQAMGGADCVILRQPIVRSAGTFQVRHDLKRVLLTLGGSDLYHLGSNLATKLAALGFAVDWISSNPSEVACVAREVRMHAPLGAEAFVQLVLANDAVLCGGGQTLHELACMGVPCVAIEQGEDQHLNLNIYEQAGYLGARIQGQGADVLKDVAARFEILRSRDLREKLSTLGRSMGDGMGAHRLAARILRRD